MSLINNGLTIDHVGSVCGTPGTKNTRTVIVFQGFLKREDFPKAGDTVHFGSNVDAAAQLLRDLGYTVIDPSPPAASGYMQVISQTPQNQSDH